MTRHRWGKAQRERGQQQRQQQRQQQDYGNNGASRPWPGPQLEGHIVGGRAVCRALYVCVGHRCERLRCWDAIARIPPPPLERT